MQFDPDLGTSERSVASLEDYLEAISRRRLLVLACVALALVGSIAFTRSRTPFYEASAKVLLRPSPAGTVDGRLAAPNLESEAQIILSDDVEDAVREQLGLAGAEELGDSIEATYVPDSNVIEVTAGATDAERASELANAYVTLYGEQRVAEQQEYYRINLEAYEAELAALVEQIEEDQATIKFLDESIGALEAQEESVDRNVAMAPLAADRAATADRVDAAAERQQEIEVELADLTRLRDGGKEAARVLSTAGVPESPKGIPDSVFWVVGGIVGLALGSILAFTRERLDRRAQNSRTVELALGGRVMGSVPRFSWRFRRGAWSLVMTNGRQNSGMQQAREAYRRLRSSLLFIARTDDVRVIVVTSSHPLEGKSTTAANLALSLALGGQSVALVSADLRRPSLETLFGVSNDRGLSEYLSGEDDERRAVRIPGAEQLDLLPAGPPVGNPGELLGSRRFSRFLDELAADYDLVIVDTPPLGSAADALAAASSAAGVIVVVDGKRTETTDLLSVRNELDRAGVRLLGAVLNRDKASRRSWFSRRNRGSYYGAERARTRRVATTAGGRASETAAGAPVDTVAGS